MSKQGSILYLDGITVSFDGFKALNSLSLIIGEGEMRAIIGPNGAGKTTMMDVITGKTRPHEGEALFGGGHRSSDARRGDDCQARIGRKFQRPSVFESHTVWDNIELALEGNRGVVDSLFHRLSPVETARIEEVLETVGLTAQARRLAAHLSHGQKQWLEIGMLLAQEPKLLLVDEPVAGMTDDETAATARLLKRIAQGKGRGRGRA